MSINDFHHVFQPSGPLKDIVRHYDWTLLDQRMGVPTIQNLPSFGHGVLFYFYDQSPVIASSHSIKEQELPRSLVLCSMGGVVTGANIVRLSFLRVVFWPGKMTTLWPGVPMSTFHDQAVDAEEHLDPGLRATHERMQAAVGPKEKVRVLDAYLVGRLEHSRHVRSVFSALEQATHGTAHPLRVATIADSLGLSRQHLNRLSRQQLGYSAREALSVLRFNRAMVRLHGKPVTSLREIAFELNYWDAAHFTHEFSKFTGLCPSAYLNQINNRNLFGEKDDFSYSGFAEKG